MTPPDAQGAAAAREEFEVRWMRPSHSLSRSYEPMVERFYNRRLAREFFAFLVADSFLQDVSVWRREVTEWSPDD